MALLRALGGSAFDHGAVCSGSSMPICALLRCPIHSERPLLYGKAAAVPRVSFEYGFPAATFPYLFRVGRLQDPKILSLET